MSSVALGNAHIAKTYYLDGWILTISKFIKGRPEGRAGFHWLLFWFPFHIVPAPSRKWNGLSGLAVDLWALESVHAGGGSHMSGVCSQQLQTPPELHVSPKGCGFLWELSLPLRAVQTASEGKGSRGKEIWAQVTCNSGLGVGNQVLVQPSPWADPRLVISPSKSLSSSADMWWFTSLLNWQWTSKTLVDIQALRLEYHTEQMWVGLPPRFKGQVNDGCKSFHAHSRCCTHVLQITQFI